MQINALVEKHHQNLPERIKTWLLEERGLSEEIINRFNLGWDGKNITIPIYNKENEYTYFKFRKDPRENSNSPKYWYSPNSSAELYGWEHIVNPKPLVIICEGELDRLILESNCFYAVTGTSGAATFSDEWIQALNRLSSQKYIALDNDEAGINGCKRIAELIPEAKIIKIPKIDGIKDVTDFIISQGAGEFQKLIDESQTLVEVEEDKVKTTIPAIEPLPDYIVPDGFLREYVDFAYPLSEAPLQFHMASSLLLAGAICKRNIYLPFGAVNIYPNLYVLIISKSGIARKTTALSPAFKMINHIDPNLIMGNMTSAEGFYDAFIESPHKIGVYSEFKTLIENCQKKYGQGLMTEITDLWDCPPCLKISLKSIPAEKRYISEPSFSILGATTIDWLELREVDITGGFFGRFLPILASEVRDKFLAMPPRMDETKFNDLVNRLHRIAAVTGEVSITPEANKFAEDMYIKKWQEYDQLPNKNHLMSHWTRIQTHVLKLAMIFKVSEYPPSLIIDRDALINAFELMRYITQYYRYLISRVAFSEDMKAENRVLEILGEVKEKGIVRSILLRRLNLPARKCNDIIETLKEKEQLVGRQEDTKTKHKTIYYASEYAPSIHNR